MTSLAISAYACRFCDAVASFFKTTIKKITFGMQMTANLKSCERVSTLRLSSAKRVQSDFAKNER